MNKMTTVIELEATYGQHLKPYLSKLNHLLLLPNVQPASNSEQSWVTDMAQFFEETYQLHCLHRLHLDSSIME